ncbi:hypothetical protein Athai_13710 [Actinocatenispora thailandica]|uniref:Uncharacterized protein n=1 Tax=Actinocatenispora thailandica TaxID=227318 RepID=A0A7R7DLL3_9ACTN|nr:hypothetical protein Athai_13710 [Actinocatenispora thailandica]
MIGSAAAPVRQAHGDPGPTTTPSGQRQRRGHSDANFRLAKHPRYTPPHCPTSTKKCVIAVAAAMRADSTRCAP